MMWWPTWSILNFTIMGHESWHFLSWFYAEYSKHHYYEVDMTTGRRRTACPDSVRCLSVKIKFKFEIRTLENRGKDKIQWIFFEGWRTFFQRRRNGLPRWFHGKVSQNLSIWQSRGNVSGFSVGDLIKHKKSGKNELGLLTCTKVKIGSNYYLKGLYFFDFETKNSSRIGESSSFRCK